MAKTLERAQMRLASCDELDVEHEPHPMPSGGWCSGVPLPVGRPWSFRPAQFPDYCPEDCDDPDCPRCIIRM